MALVPNAILLPSVNWLANFLAADIRPGNIYYLDEKQFVLDSHLSDHVPGLNLSHLLRRSDPADFKLIRETGVETGFAGNNFPELDADEVSITFTKKNSALALFEQAVITSFKPSLVAEVSAEVWAQRKFNPSRYLLVTQVLRAESGLLLYSEAKNNHVTLRHRQHQRVKKVMDLATGRFEYITNSKPTLEWFSEKSFLPLFSAVQFTRAGKMNWL